jgi:hypothetical protein
MQTQLEIVKKLSYAAGGDTPITSIYSGPNASRPNAASAGAGALLVTTDHLRLLLSNGSVWKDITQEFASRAALPSVSVFGGRVIGTTDSGELFIDDGSTGPVPINIASRGMMQGFKASYTSAALAGCGPGECSSELVGGYRHFLTHPTGMEKLTTSEWQAGDGNGGWPSATAVLPTGGWMHFFAIGHTDGVQTDFGWDTDVDATNLLAPGGAPALAGFDQSYRRIYSIRTLAATQDIARIRQQGDWFYYDDPTALINDDVAPTTPSILATLLNAPLGIETQVLCNIGENPGAIEAVSATSGLATNVDAASTNPYADGQVPMFAAIGGTDEVAGQFLAHTDTLQRIRIGSASLSDIALLVLGWMDDRGRFA